MDLYRLLLKAYPRPFRRLYQDEMEADFRDLLARTRAGSRWAVLRLWGATAVDTLRTGLGERLSRRGYRVGRSRVRIPRRSLAGWLADSGGDLRQALRTLGRAPGYVAAVVTTLALGIGANTALFSVAYGTLFRPLPFQDGHRLVHLSQELPARGDSGLASRVGFSVQDLASYAASVPALAEVSEYHAMVFTLIDEQGPHRVRAGVVSANYFDFLGLEALHGRVLRPDEDHLGADPVIVLTHRYWMERLGGDPSVVGRRVRMNDQVHEIVGVLPPRPQFPMEGDIFLPISACPTRSDPAFMAERTRRMMYAYGRLTPGEDVPTAAAQVESALAALAVAYPDAYPLERGFQVRTAPLRDEMVASVRPIVVALLAVAAFVLLVACANAAGLALARAGRRARELEVRGALGAGRFRLVRTLMAEGVLLALAGGVAGLVIAVAGHDLLVAFASRFTTRAQEIHLDRAVLLFALGTSVATGLVFGAVPGLWIGGRVRLGSMESGHTTGGARSRGLQRLLVVGQVAVAYAVVALAGLALRTAWVVSRTDLGFDTSQVVSVEVGLDQGRYQSPQAARALFDTFKARLEEHPDVVKAARVMGGPLTGLSHTDAFFLERVDGTSEAVTALVRVVDPGAFEILGMDLLQGRGPRTSDGPAGPLVAVVNRAFYDRYMAGRFTLGTRITRCHGPDDCPETMTVVGVVENVRFDGPDELVAPEVYQVGRQLAWGGERMLVELRRWTPGLAAELVALIHEVDPDLAVSDVATLDDLRRDRNQPRRFLALLLGTLAAVAGGLAVTGIFGVASLSASARTRELGIRRALGAEAAGVRRLVVGEGVGVAVAGLVLGLVLVLGLTAAFARFMERFLWGIPPYDPATLAATALLFLGVAALATWLPARRASAVDVMQVLGEP